MRQNILVVAFVTFVIVLINCPKTNSQITNWKSLEPRQEGLLVPSSRDSIAYGIAGSIRWGDGLIGMCPVAYGGKGTRLYISPLSPKKSLFVALCWEDGKGGTYAQIIDSRTKQAITGNIVPKGWGIGAWVNWSSNEEFAIFFATGKVTMGDMVWVNLVANKSGPLQFKHFTDDPRSEQSMEETQDANTDTVRWVTPTAFTLLLEAHCNPYELGDKCDRNKVLRRNAAQVDVNTLAITYPALDDTTQKMADIEDLRRNPDSIKEPSRSGSSNDDFRALYDYLKKNLPSKNPYEKTAEYESRLDGVLRQKVIRDLTGKSSWSFSLPFCEKGGMLGVPSKVPECLGWNGKTEYNADEETFQMTFWASWPLSLYFDQDHPSYGNDRPFRSDFQGDYSQIQGLPVTAQFGSPITYLINFKIPPEEARNLSDRLALEITFKPQFPFLSRDGLTDAVHGLVKQLKVFNKLTSKVYAKFYIPSDAATKPIPVKINVPSEKVGTFAKPSLPAATDYSKFLGTWTYVDAGDKWYFKISRDSKGKFQFVDAYQYQDQITWRTDVMLTHSKGIFLNPLKGKLDGRFLSGNFTPTHGNDVLYRITLQLQPDGRILYLMYMGGHIVGKYYATKT
jgi:hypothetical protein